MNVDLVPEHLLNIKLPSVAAWFCVIKATTYDLKTEQICYPATQFMAGVDLVCRDYNFSIAHHAQYA